MFCQNSQRQVSVTSFIVEQRMGSQKSTSTPTDNEGLGDKLSYQLYNSTGQRCDLIYLVTTPAERVVEALLE